jgi:hypothetical protein
MKIYTCQKFFTFFNASSAFSSLHQRPKNKLGFIKVLKKYEVIDIKQSLEIFGGKTDLDVLLRENTEEKMFWGIFFGKETCVRLRCL